MEDCKYEERCTECFTYSACHETGNIYPDKICHYYQEKENGEKQVQEKLKRVEERLRKLFAMEI